MIAEQQPNLIEKVFSGRLPFCVTPIDRRGSKQFEEVARKDCKSILCEVSPVLSQPHRSKEPFVPLERHLLATFSGFFSHFNS
uniref:Uncharacterized protein n=1 Tax=Tetranychus urticae TaxID=32264 RepID=T1L0E8_TETUR